MSVKLDKASKMMASIDYKFNNLWNPNEVLKNRIRSLLDKKPNLDQVDIADKLNLDLELVCQMCRELLDEGKIRIKPEKLVKTRKNKWRLS